jgi:hypothetical protein
MVLFCPGLEIIPSLFPRQVKKASNLLILLKSTPMVEYPDIIFACGNRSPGGKCCFLEEAVNFEIQED